MTTHSVRDTDRLLADYGIAFDLERHNRFNDRHFIKEGSLRRLHPDAAELGVVPFLLDHRYNSGILRHRHDFFELTLILDGRGVYGVDGAKVDLVPGSLVFMDHSRYHQYSVGNPPLRLINVCFDPTLLSPVVGRRGFDAARHFRLFRPFFWEKGAGVALVPNPVLFRRLLVLALELMCRFQGSGPRRGESVRSALLSLLHGVLDVYEGERPLPAPDEAFLETVLSLSKAGEAPPDLKTLAGRFGMSPSSFSRRFKKQVGETLPTFWNRQRVARATEFLRSGRFQVTEAAIECGFDSLSHFHRVFKDVTGETPGAFLKRVRG